MGDGNITEFIVADGEIALPACIIRVQRGEALSYIQRVLKSGVGGG